RPELDLRRRPADPRRFVPRDEHGPPSGGGGDPGGGRPPKRPPAARNRAPRANGLPRGETACRPGDADRGQPLTGKSDAGGTSGDRPTKGRAATATSSKRLFQTPGRRGALMSEWATEMARKPRNEVAGSVYHATIHSVAGAVIVANDRDRTILLQAFAEVAK